MDSASIQAAAAVAQLIAAVLLIVVTWRYVALTDKLLRAQIDPLIAFEFNMADQTLTVGNDGIYPVANLSVLTDTVVFAGLSSEVRLGTLRSGRPIPGAPRHDWWHISSLAPHDVQKQSISDVADNAVRMIRVYEEAHAKNSLRGLTATQQVQLYAVMLGHLTYHREVDNKQYRAVKKLVVFADPKTGNPARVWDTEVMGDIMKLPDVGPCGPKVGGR